MIAGSADRREQPAPPCPPDRQLAVGRVKLGREAHVAVDQKGVEPENLHLLGGFDAGGGLPDVIEFAPLRRAAKIERITFGAKMRLAQKGRRQGENKQRDEPGRIDNEAGGEARHRHHVLRLAQQLAH